MNTLGKRNQTVNVMNKRLINTLIPASVALLALAAAPAMAADLSVKAPARVQPAYNWTGCYLGVQGGGLFGHSTHNAESGPFSGLQETPTFETGGELFGGTVGCNYQTGWLVVGAEGDIGWTNYKGWSQDLSGVDGPFAASQASYTKESWLATYRGRIGYAWDAAKDGSTAMIYVTAGGASANVSILGCNGACNSSSSTTMTGWAAGGGIELPIYRTAWTFKFDYIYADLGTTNFSVLVPGIGTGVRKVAVDDNIVRIGINYRFGGGPVVAAY
jgi:outer membrane immunogenic protein